MPAFICRHDLIGLQGAAPHKGKVKYITQDMRIITISAKQHISYGYPKANPP